MAPVMASWGSRAGRSARICSAASDNETRAGLACAAAGTRRVREALPVGWAAKFCGGLGAASGPSEALGASAGVMRCLDRPAWLSRLEHFDDDHAPALTGRAFCQRSTGKFLVLVAIIPGGLVVRRHRLRHGEKLTTSGELLLAVAIGQEAIVADALKALRQNMEQEAAN